MTTVTEPNVGLGTRLTGYASVFNVPSEPLGGFVETIAPGAFSHVLHDDVRALLNHDPNYVLGRTTAGTLRLRQDSHGLAIEVDPPRTSFARNLIESIRRRDVTQMSFSFAVGKDRWTDGSPMKREILQLAKLFDVSPVTFPAYTATTADLRSSTDVETRLGRNRAMDRTHREMATAALQSARCTVCGGAATSITIDWRSNPPKGAGRCPLHQESIPSARIRPVRLATLRNSPTPRLDMIRRRERLRLLESSLKAAGR